MAGSLISFEAVAEGPVSSKNLVGKVLGDAASKARVEALLDRQKERAKEVLAANGDLVMALRDALIARDELVGDEITDVIEVAVAARRADDVIVVPDVAPAGED
jgi:hypothetical protein